VSFVKKIVSGVFCIHINVNVSGEVTLYKMLPHKLRHKGKEQISADKLFHVQ